ncbi:kinase-like domain-containing protein [Rhizophagus diaphanus]|nr:kinase-like domain-containing protein [Rhizophagus diaphanus] [Rhizophagus sp. MUCL 43196]
MLVMNIMDIDLRKYLQRTHNQLSWKEKIKIAYDIIIALGAIHGENAIHRDLHSGNILFSQLFQDCYIGDLGFCGPPDKAQESIYGNLPYLAPEVISGKKTTKKSDIYSIAMLMWEISSGQPPFNNYENDYNLALKIINGMRPKVIAGTPLKYKNLMEQCWDADPSKRLDINTLFKEIRELLQSFQNISNEIFQQETNNLEMNKINESITNHKSSKLFTSKIYQFKNLPEPRNATEDDNEELSKSFNELQINSNEDNQINYVKEIVEQQQIKNINIDDEDEIYDDKNFHSEEQDELEIPDGKCFYIIICALYTCFNKWISGNELIDEFIQDVQLKARNRREVIEWIPYNRLKNIQYLAQGGFSIIYKVILLDGFIKILDNKKQQWERIFDKPKDEDYENA